MNKPVLVVLAFLGIFLAGGVSGALLGVRISDDMAHRRAAELFAQQQFKRIGDQLGLSQEQRGRIRPILTNSGKEVQEHRRAILKIVDKMEADVRQELTDEQRAQYDKVRSRLRDNDRLWQRWLREQRARRHDALGSGAAPSAPPATGAPSP